MSAPTNSRSAGGAAAAVFIITIICGAVAGIGVGATKSSTGDFFSTDWATMTEQPLTGANKTFNWLLFSVFAAAAIVAAAAAWAGATIANATDAASARQLAAIATLKPASAAPPALPPMGSTPPVSPPHDPPYL